MERVAALHAALLPEASAPGPDSACWLVWDGGRAVGYAAASYLASEQGIYLTQAGVLSCARGHGLQQRLIAAREKWGRKIGATISLTYTWDNPPSANNLIRQGYLMYDPANPWAGTVQYWYKKL